MKRLTTYLNIACIGALLCLPVFALRAIGAEDVPVPAAIQVPILLRILTFDRNFDERFKTQLSIGVVFSDNDPASRKNRDEIVEVLKNYVGKTVKHLAITFVLMRVTTEEDMLKSARSQGVNVFYIAAGNEKHLAALLRISQRQRIITVTGVPHYVKEGISVGLGITSESKTQIFINLKSAKAEGIVFDANLLRLSTVLQ